MKIYKETEYTLVVDLHCENRVCLEINKNSCKNNLEF